MKNLKYLAIGIVAGLLIPYAIAFYKSKKENPITFRHTYDDNEEENEY
ncbi:hypothetical protein [endosymbiont GvMRE of Glomus versiforme]|nr:hypothetical protein [endosymbiont GvMRE of Glomus versiforme]RHZ36598.1 hypothetical protein GvMRE_I2g551 [endosymbiont GvMRE of Glomus versiforme]RHZ37426.1 hypothetical protein GvMRE_I1g731 [endosymbiont GvMRE of Glomus versiforme]